MDATLMMIDAEKAVAVFPNPEPETTFLAADLVASGPAVVFCFRRPGSGLCREEAEKAYARIIEMKAAGATRVVALLKEDIGTEVEEFKKYWPGDIYVDVDMHFYKALGGGEVYAPLNMLSWFAAMANPWSKSKAKKNLAKNKQKGYASTMNGEDFIQGGVFVLRPDGTAAYSFLEEDMGDSAPLIGVIRACREALSPGSRLSTAISATTTAVTRTSASTRTATRAGTANGPVVIGTATTKTMTNGSSQATQQRQTTTGSQQPVQGTVERVHHPSQVAAKRQGTGPTQGAQKTRTGSK